MQELFENAVYVDWKCESEDVVYLLRERYEAECSFILQKNFDELAENYATEELEDFLNAIGQECTCFGNYLYEIETDSDSYALVIVPIEKEDDFKAVLKKNKCKGTLRKQARRKEGVSAKRIDLGKRLPNKKIVLKEGYSINLVTDCLDGNLLLDYSDFSERRFCSAMLNINEWQPTQTSDYELIVRRLSRNENGLYVAKTQGNFVNEKGYLADKNNKILIGSDLTKLDKWQCVYEKENLEWSAFEWFNNELFVADKNLVYYIKDVNNFHGSIKKVLELEGGDFRWYPKFFVVGNQLFLFMHQSVYKWIEGQMFDKIYEIEGFNVWDFVPVGENKVAFQVRPESVNRGTTESELTLLDINTLEVEKYPCHYGNVRKWTENRVCILAVEPTAKMSIMECFDFETNEKKVLKYGALGKDCVRDIYETDCGTVIVGSEKNIYLTTQLWEFMNVEKN